jgi:hypothetical protein
VSILFTRREALAMLAAAPVGLPAQRASQLPLKTSGLEHVGFTVPDPQQSAAFYGRIFDPQIFQEMMPPLRYYCRLGIGYVAFGPNANAPARIDHFCATAARAWSCLVCPPAANIGTPAFGCQAPTSRSS